VTVVATADPPAGTSVNVEPVRLAAFMASLNVAVTVEVMATPVALLSGVTAVTVGTGPCAVVKVQA
jgi:hypothetical protein